MDFHDWPIKAGHNASTLSDGERTVLHRKYHAEQRAELGDEHTELANMRTLAAKWKGLTPSERADDKISAAYSLACEGKIGVADVDNEELQSYRAHVGKHARRHAEGIRRRLRRERARDIGGGAAAAHRR